MRIIHTLQAILALTTSVVTAQGPQTNNTPTTPTTSTSRPIAPSATPGQTQKQPFSTWDVQNANHAKFCTISELNRQLCRTLSRHVQLCANSLNQKKRPAICSQESAEYLLKSLLAQEPCAGIDSKDEMTTQVCLAWWSQSDRCRRQVVGVMQRCPMFHLLYELNGWNQFLNNP